ncbi:MAG: hypothetical protein GXO86_11910 [Chlorobi bacterium]|nr:hypothetical protein [Chlorobiota bacterium]
MDIQTKKLNFIQEFLRLTDEKVIDKLNRILKSERKKQIEKDLSPMSIEQLNDEIDKAVEDAKNERVIKATGLKDKWV